VPCRSSMLHVLAMSRLQEAAARNPLALTCPSHMRTILQVVKVSSRSFDQCCGAEEFLEVTGQIHRPLNGDKPSLAQRTAIGESGTGDTIHRTRLLATSLLVWGTLGSTWTSIHDRRAPFTLLPGCSEVRYMTRPRSTAREP